MDYTLEEKKEFMIKLIKKFWYGYKVCEGCDTLVNEEIPVCPVCRVYRFDNSKERVFEIADRVLIEENFIDPI
jgi:RNA polymerase subunit RPABC4/transcription elongation factor Spt4